MHLQHDSLLFLPLASRFTTFWLGRVQKQNFEIALGQESDLRLWAFRFLNFFRLSFLSFSFLFAAVIDLLLGLLEVKMLLTKRHQDGQFLPWSSPCSGRKFCSEFFTQRFEHFCAYLRHHSANHSDLGIIGKIFSSCRS